MGVAQQDPEGIGGSLRHTVGDGTACVESPHSVGTAGPWDLPCRPDSMVIQVESSNEYWPGVSIQNDKYGFMWAQDVPCLIDGSVERDPYGSYSGLSGEAGLYYGVDPGSSRLVESGLAKMHDGRKAYYRQWQVACDVNRVYTMDIWYLPVSEVACYVLAVRPDDVGNYRRIIASMDLTGRVGAGQSQAATS